MAEYTKRTVLNYSRAARMRTHGFSYRKVADVLGLDANTIRRWLDPDYREKQLALQRRWWAQKKGKHSKYYAANMDPDSPRFVPSMPFVRCLDGVAFDTFQMVRP